ncbi:3-hydroxyacyl-CoA dehydrogenase NAD-binding domain-containing protein [Opitutus sp. GAS368]|jgi:3-hydroxyacyl-CoA dehydrogenase/enoyl-CoA hydratase/3-hydroxybutyryl-CoA epimerase|uniref:3-hydroxyacyl-CoA dehydrogenase NAD-binding domain-containing protein n=1 Tax=Opitutus sp. GAS368 TaxID=1882749 RepID=UPI00087A5D75|nr:3-hydroxyacyl-CoA dehydrogenase NAD-binding domain-containing protein [Opitutus sp. GAS368]SDS07836.1 short chain enoyl-CoA hydratase /3-hydroxyacyl-CoA dehydrogenase [Opitutus sp. GAS368]
MSDSTPVTHSVDAEGVGWIVFDDPTGRANVFNPTTQAAFRAAVAALAARSPKAVVVHSAKEKIFIAGADLKWLVALPDAAAAKKLSHDGQELFASLSGLKVPVVCAIHGACAGGGYELALACHWRLATDAKETVIGLPEVGIGVIPGWGGCARLPRLIGAEAAVTHMLKAALVPAAAAQPAGLVDELVPAAELKARAQAAALRLAAGGLPRRADWPAASPDFFAGQRQAVLAKQRGQPAPLAVLDAVEKGAGLPLAAALDLEAELFGGVAAGEVARNLIHVFLLKEAGKKLTTDAWFPQEKAAAKVEPFRIIGIIGAGVMGSGIAQWCASRGFGVILCDTDKEAVERGIKVIRGLFKQQEERGALTAAEAHRMMGGIGVTTSLEDFDVCDLVIEAIVENVGAKQKLFAELSKVMAPDCVFASNTSALPLEELASTATNPGRVIGLHFFNPVGRMPLVELVLGKATTRATADRALAFVKTLGKTPVICRSSPGFLVTRVLFFYLNEACRLWEQGASTEAIDRALRDWGWPMGPMRLIDEVGVDVTDFIFAEMQHYFPDRFTRTTVTQKMLTAGLKGRKNGASSGFYAYADGKETLNAAMASFAPAAKTAPEAVAEKLNGVMIDETKRVLAEGVLKTADEADLALLLGAGFPAWRGGLMRYARSSGQFAG